MIPDEFNLSGQELQILSELDSKQYGVLKLAAVENAKKRALVAKVRWSWEIAVMVVCARKGRHDNTRHSGTFFRR